ncbi:MAG: amino acid permease [Verrucomicrobia bacterium]|nr:MAG: amino acid permease [Verrucomicrobiota bacterium]
MNLLRRKSVTQLQSDALTDHRLKRALGATNLTALGIGAIIGTGIFVLTGTVAAQNAGPAVVLSFVLAGVASIFAALCYSEFASLVPMAGSAYTYGYATLGEVFAWIIGWDLILEYALGAVTVSIGWSGYVVSFLHDIGIDIPAQLSAARGTLITLADGTQVAAIFNLPAVIIIGIVTLLLVIGIKESANANNVIVIIKVAVVLLFIVGAAHAVNPANWHPFMPPSTGVRGQFGWSGVMQGAGIVFFAYIGFDAVSTAAQEAKNPQRDMPIGIIGSLLICTVLYILVSGVATGIMSYHDLNVPDPIAVAADHAGLGWMSSLIKLGAIAGLSSVILVMLLGQSRILWTMADDGLMPKFVSKVHPKFRTPWITTILTGVVVAFFAAILPIRDAASLVSIGTLLAFVIVSIGVLVLRVREPELPRKFKAPIVWFVAPMGALSALYLMISLPWRTWERLIIWFVIGMVVYFFYGVRRSNLAKQRV